MKANVLIIGAGPAGLATAGRLRKMGIDFRVVERTDKIAAAWHGHYDRLHLHTVKELSHLPHLPFPESYPRYISRQQLVDYCEDYARQFDIRPLFGHLVTRITRAGDFWEVQFENGKTDTAQYVVIATGANRVPNAPKWPGMENFSGQILHSRDYKNAKPFVGKRVLVVGMGNTGAEIALDLSEHNIDTTLSVRSPVSVVPRDFLGRPVQLTAKKLARLPFEVGDRIGSFVRSIVFGDLRRFGIPVSKVPPAVQLRETGKSPVIDLGTIQQIKAGKIAVQGGIDGFNSDGVRFINGKVANFDTVIVATGYRPKLEEIIPSIAPELDAYGMPDSAVASSSENRGLYFVGFDNYQLGGILGTIFTDSETVVKGISQGFSK